jgi:hypothetical protein
VGFVERGVGAIPAEAQHQFVTDDAADHTAADEKGNAVEHLLLADVRDIREDHQYTIGETLIERHRRRVIN